MKDLCSPGENTTAKWRQAKKGESVHEWAAKQGVRPERVKRPRMKCPQCGRKIIASVRVCDDGCCIIFYIPPHKPKGWWKKK